MSKEEIRSLEKLDPSGFDEREYIALSWVRSVLTMPDGPPPELDEALHTAFSARERRYIITAMKAVYFFNLLGNTAERWTRRLLRFPEPEPNAACTLDLG
ncbi:MAG: hypothetical protein SWK76_17725 [Actinomycetota bacterium]|nr:hypothetical protein [Actinomycetota bacterium]